ncbi:hypothetical protein A2U01_0068842, partial [Trifolium medium]|nr:hypothetical protein [Trifolium medium]
GKGFGLFFEVPKLFWWHGLMERDPMAKKGVSRPGVFVGCSCWSVQMFSSGLEWGSAGA